MQECILIKCIGNDTLMEMITGIKLETDQTYLRKKTQVRY